MYIMVEYNSYGIEKCQIVSNSHFWWVVYTAHAVGSTLTCCIFKGIHAGVALAREEDDLGVLVVVWY